MSQKLSKTLGRYSGTLLFLNVVLGAGLLTLPGLVYQKQGAFSMASWVVAGLAAFPLVGLFVILGRRYPHAGGISHYAKRAFGPIGQRISVYLLLGAVSLGIPSIALAGGYYLQSFYALSPHIYAVALLLLVAIFHMYSGKTATKFFSFISSGLLFALIILVVVLLIQIDFQHLKPIKTPTLHTEDIQQIMSPFMMIFFAFTGWEVATHIVEDFKNPKKDFAWAMLCSFFLALMLYLSLAWVVTQSELTKHFEAPFSHMMDKAFGEMGKYMVGGLAVLLITANLFGAIWAISRLVYALARDSILPKSFSKTHNGQPLRALALTLAVFILVLLVDAYLHINIKGLLALSGQNFLLLYLIAALSLWLISKDLWHRMLSLGIVFECFILFWFSGDYLIYPLSLMGLAILHNWWINRVQT